MSISINQPLLTVASLTSTQRDALTSEDGAIIYNTTISNLEGKSNGNWSVLTGGGGADRTYDLGEGASGGWSATGPGFTGANNNPTIYVLPGETYVFTTALSGHPPVVKLNNGGPYGDPYTVVATGSANYVYWSVPMDAKREVYYVFSDNNDGKKLRLQCDKIHSNFDASLNEIPTVTASAMTWGSSGGFHFVYSNATTASVKNGGKITLYSNSSNSNRPYVDIGINPSMNILESSSTFYFPMGNGTSGHVLQTDGVGGTSWVAPPSGGGASTLVALTDTDLPAVTATPSAGRMSTNTALLPTYPVAWNPSTNKFEIAYGIASGTNYRDSQSSVPGGTFESICLGRHSAPYGEYSVCIGTGHTRSYATQSIAIGGGSVGKSGGFGLGSPHAAPFAYCSGEHSIAIGTQATSYSDHSIAIGYKCVAQSRSTSIGYQCSSSNKDNTVLLGFNCTATKNNQIIINAHNSSGLSGGSNSNSLYINPIRHPLSKTTNNQPTPDFITSYIGNLGYDSSTKEIVSMPPITASYDLVNDSTTAWTVSGPGIAGTQSNGTLVVVRGATYRFNASGASSHPLALHKDSSNHTEGVVKTANNQLFWSVPQSGTGVYELVCTSHSAMKVTLEIPSKNKFNDVYIDNTSYFDDESTIITGGHNISSALLIRRGSEVLSEQTAGVYPYTMVECHAVHHDHVDDPLNETTAQNNANALGSIINESNLFGFTNVKFKTTQSGSGGVGGSPVAAFPVVTYIASGHGYFNSSDPTNFSRTTNSHDRRRDSNIAFFTSRDNADLGSGDNQNSELDPKLAMLISPDGRVGIGGAKNLKGVLQISQRHGDYEVVTRNRAVPFITFTGSDTDAKAETVIGDISRSGESTVVYNTSSDYRVKKNVTDFSGGLGVVNALLPKSFNFIDDSDDSKKTIGFLAHEVSHVTNGVITGEKDAIDEDGSPLLQKIDHSKLVPYLVSAVKELMARVASLEEAIKIHD